MFRSLSLLLTVVLLAATTVSAQHISKDELLFPLSQKPGIGVETNEDGLRRYAAEGVPFFE